MEKIFLGGLAGDSSQLPDVGHGPDPQGEDVDVGSLGLGRLPHGLQDVVGLAVGDDNPDPVHAFPGSEPWVEHLSPHEADGLGRVGCVARRLLDVSYGQEHVLLVEVGVEVELGVGVLAERGHAHPRGVLPDHEHRHDVLDEVQLSAEVRAPDAVGGVQEEDDVGRLVAAVLHWNKQTGGETNDED